MSLVLPSRLSQLALPARYATGIRWDNPLTKDLALAWVAGVPIELVGNKPVYGYQPSTPHSWRYRQVVSADVRRTRVVGSIGGLARPQQTSAGNTIFVIGSQPNSATARNEAFVIYNTGATSQIHLSFNSYGIYYDEAGDGKMEVFVAGPSTFSYWTAVPGSGLNGAIGSFAGVFSQYTADGIYVNGSAVSQYSGSSSGSPAWASGGAYQWRVGAASYGSADEVGTRSLALFWNRKLPAGDIAQVHSDPWKLFEFEAPQRRIYLPAAAAGTVDLASAAIAGATASAALLIVKSLLGEAAGGALAAGVLDLGKPLAGGATASAQAAGDISQTVTLTGAAAGGADAAGSISIAIPLSAAAVAGSAGAGELSITVALSGGAVAAAVAAAALTRAALLSAQATGGATAAGALTVEGQGQVALAGEAQASAQAAAALAVGKGLAGAAVAGATALGNLTLTFQLAGGALAAGSAAATLQLSVPLTAAAIATAVAEGGLVADIHLAGAATASAQAAANFIPTVQLQAAATGSLIAAATLAETVVYSPSEKWTVHSAGRDWTVRA